ncbi:MAG: NUDIX hydrolase [Phascolarctobacterium sp.]|nr:NUDIX hydrolase [Phascolarctobacterium sp.]
MELWDIYDKNKQLTGRTMVRNDWKLKDDEYHLTVLGIIRNKEGKYLITQRVMTKSWAAGWWEVSGGGVQAGESSRKAVNREVLEETGLDVSALEPICMLTYVRENPGEGDNYFVDYYLFELDFSESDIKLQVEEAMGFKLAALSEIQELASQGIFLHYDSIKEIFKK